VGYTATLQINFSALASAFPFWIFAAAAMEIFGVTRAIGFRAVTHGRLVTVAGSLAGVAIVGLGAVSIVFPYLADSRLLTAVNADYAGRSREAEAPASQARAFWPWESVYAVEVGNLAFEHGDWAAAREAYRDAADLGTYNPLVYRNLALADRNLGLRSEGEAAARKAVELDRFDPANRALLAEFEVSAT